MNGATDERAQAVLLTMQRNRELLMEAYRPSSVKGDQFPRSATFRWLGSHLSGKAIMSTLVSAALARPSWLRVLTLLASRRRTAGK